MPVNHRSDRLTRFERLVRAMHTARTVKEVSDLFLHALIETYGPLAYAEMVLDGAGGVTGKGGADRGNGGENGERGGGDAYRVTRFRRHDGVEVVPDHSPFLAANQPVYSRGVFARIASGPPHIHVGTLEDVVPPDDPFPSAYASYEGYLAIPIYSAGMPEWLVLFKSSLIELRTMPLDDLLLHANLVGAMLNSMVASTSLREAQRRIHQEVERIATISRALLPQATPAIPGLEVAFKVTAYDRAGGDLVEFGGTPSGNWGLAIADASGHGPSAAVVAAIVSTIIRTLPVFESPNRLAAVSQFLTVANHHLCEKRIEDSFVTAIVAAWQPDTRTLTYARAGHPPPLLRRAADRSVMPIVDGSGIPLGIFPDTIYQAAQITLSPGDLLLFYSDGIIETINPAQDFFGDARLAALLTDVQTAPEALTQIESALDSFAQGISPTDDRTLLAVRVL